MKKILGIIVSLSLLCIVGCGSDYEGTWKWS
jgi:uncharacterized protein YcfL